MHDEATPLSTETPLPSTGPYLCGHKQVEGIHPWYRAALEKLGLELLLITEYQAAALMGTQRATRYRYEQLIGLS